MRGHSDSFPLVLIGGVAALSLVFKSFYEDALKAWVVKRLAEQFGPLATDVLSGLVEIVPAISIAIFIVWGLYAYIARSFKAKSVREFDYKRLRLARLRGDGVNLRNASLQLEMVGGDFPELETAMDAWEQQAIAAISDIDPADAETFRYLDEVPQPKIPLSSPRKHHEGAHIKAHREHDYRLKKLVILIDRYATRQA